MDWNKTLSRLSVPGLTLLALGALTCIRGPEWCRVAFGRRLERWAMPVKFFGLALAILGALILLDVIPGL